MTPRRWLTLVPLLIVAVAMACWAVPGSAAVQSAAAQSPAVQSAVVHRLAPAAVRATPSCNPVASSLRPTGPPRVAPGSFMAKIRARGYLIAGVSQSTYPFGFVNPLNGNTEGFDIDMVHAVAKAIFGNPNKIEYKAISDDQRIPEVQSGAVDER